LNLRKFSLHLREGGGAVGDLARVFLLRPITGQLRFQRLLLPAGIGERLFELLGAGGLLFVGRLHFPARALHLVAHRRQQGALLLDLLQGSLGALPFALDLLPRGLERGLIRGELGQGVFGILREREHLAEQDVPVLQQVLKRFDALGQSGLYVSG
jgi:hypothetical protein